MEQPDRQTNPSEAVLTLTHTYTYIYIHTNTQTHTLTHTHRYIHTYIHTNTHTHTHTHTHTQGQLPVTSTRAPGSTQPALGRTVKSHGAVVRILNAIARGAMFVILSTVRDTRRKRSTAWCETKERDGSAAPTCMDFFGSKMKIWTSPDRWRRRVSVSSTCELGEPRGLLAGRAGASARCRGVVGRDVRGDAVAEPRGEAGAIGAMVADAGS
jgi:hypothetical protein